MGWGSHNTRTKHGQICFPFPHFTSSPDTTKRNIPLCKPPCSGPTHHQFLASPPKPGTCMSPAGKLSPSPTCPVSLPAPSERQTKGLPPPLSFRVAKSWGSYSQALGWVMALQRGTSWILLVAQPPPFTSSCRSALHLPTLCPGTPPSLHPSSEQLSTTQAPLTRYKGHRHVPKAALEVTYETRWQNSS